MAPFPDFLVRALRRRIAPTKTVGTPGVAIYAGYVESDEINRELADPETRYKTYGDMLANTSIIAAGVRYFLNMVGGAKWTFEPAEADASGEYAERLEKILTEDPMTPWHRIVRRACMYRFFGFSVQEWIVRRHEEGHLTYADIAPRSQRTIYRWDVEPTGEVKGMVQRIPQTGLEVYIPRNKVLYLVDDSINDSPEGLGLFRHLVEPSKRLERYQELEGYGFETDLRGIPIGYGPFAELAEKVAQKELTPEDRDKIEKPLRDFIKGHVRSPKLAAVLDSAPYTTTDEAGRPSNMRQWQIDLLKGSSQSFKENAAAIERLTRDMARILNVEHLLLGSTSAGSFALSEDKSQAFHQVVDGALREVGEAVSADLVDPIWKLNGWPDEMKPQIEPEAVHPQDAGEVAAALRDMATAGVPMDADDPAINDVREMMGLTLLDPDEQRRRMEEDAALRRESMMPPPNPTPGDPAPMPAGGGE